MASCLFPPPSALPSENPDDLLNNPSKKEGKMSAKLLPICPLVSLLVSSLHQSPLGSKRKGTSTTPLPSRDPWVARCPLYP